LDVRDKEINILNSECKTCKTCILALNKFNADLAFEIKSLREMNKALSNDFNNLKETFNNKEENKDSLNGLISQIEKNSTANNLKLHIDNMIKANNTRINKRDLIEVQILDL